MKTALRIAGLFLVAVSAMVPGTWAQEKSDNDHTLQAMRDEMARAKDRLELKFPGTDQPVPPYYLEYRLLDLDVREVGAEFGALMASTHLKHRFINVQAQLGDSDEGNSNL